MFWLLSAAAAVALAGSMSGQAFSQGQTTAQDRAAVKGVIMEIAQDGSYIMVENTKVLTTQDFIDTFSLEQGDWVEIVAEKNDNGLTAQTAGFGLEEEDAPIDEQTPRDYEKNFPDAGMELP